ncbi:hypothetical protein C5O80_00380 [Burkholderia sp. SRS-46]|nr:hypothetical protein C5O80_00380 [Burkholderia sp. SRS-46]
MCDPHFHSPATSRSLLPVESGTGHRPAMPECACFDRRQTLNLRIVKPITDSENNVNPRHHPGDGITI